MFDVFLNKIKELRKKTTKKKKKMSRPLVTPEMKPSFDRWAVSVLSPVYEGEPATLAEFVFALLVSKTDPVSELKATCQTELVDFLGDTAEYFVNLLFTKLKQGFDDGSSSSSSSSSRQGEQLRGGSGSYPLGNSRKRNSPERHDGPRYPSQPSHYESRDGPRGRDGRGRYEDDRDRRGGDDYRRGGDDYRERDRSGRLRNEEYPKRPRTSERDRDWDRDGRDAGRDAGRDVGRDAGRDGRDGRERDSSSSSRPSSGHLPSSNSSSSGYSGTPSAAPSDRRRSSPDSPPAQQELDPPKLTTIKVENIPDAHNTASALMSQFGPFGTVIAVTAKPSQKKAYIQFATALQAEQAIRSPDPIFNNRFISITMASRGRSVASGRGGAFAAHPAVSHQPHHLTHHPQQQQQQQQQPPRQPLLLPSRDQLKIKKPVVEGAAPAVSGLPECEEPGEIVPQAPSPASALPVFDAKTSDFVRGQLELQSEIFRLLKKPGLSDKAKASLKQQLMTVVASLETSFTYAAPAPLTLPAEPSSASSADPSTVPSADLALPESAPHLHEQDDDSSAQALPSEEVDVAST